MCNFTWQYGLSILLLCLILSLSPHPIFAADMNGVISPDCDMDKGPCSKKIGNAEVILDIQPKPVSAMRELMVYVSLKDAGVYEKLKVKFSMPGMHMGRNEVILVRTNDGRYAGKGIIPRCPSGKKLWRATVEIPTQKSTKTEKIDFLFNITY